MKSTYKLISNTKYVQRVLIVFTLLAVAALQPAAAESLVIKNLGTLPGGNSSQAVGINERGQVVAFDASVDRHAFLFEKGVMTDLGTLPGGNKSAAYGINERGQVVGSSNTASGWQQHAFLFEKGVMTDLGTLPGDNQSIAQGINNHGQVAGYSAPDSSVWHAVLWTRER